MTCKILYIFLLIFSSAGLYAQSYDTKIEEARLTIESSLYPGFKTFLDFDYEEVRKGWWKFARDFGKPVNMRKYYETTLIHEEMANVKLISKSLKYGRGCMFYLTLKNEEVPAGLEKKYLNQVKTLLFEFKQEYYLSFLQDELKTLEKQAMRVTRKLDKSRGDASAENKCFNELKKVNEALTNTKEKVAALSK